MANGNTIPIDWNKVDRLIECGNDGVKVAANIGIHPHTLYRRCEEEKGVSFGAYQAEKRSRGISLLLAKQYEVAMKGNTTMLVWVGKQMAGQKDEQNFSGALTVNTMDFSNARTEDDQPSPQIPSEELSD